VDVIEHAGADEPHYWSIERPYCEVTIERRQPYCDRGSYIAQVFPRGRYVREFDVQDGWPRDDFAWARMRAEIEAWLAIRDARVQRQYERMGRR
jgi:hypothetical protein